MNDAHGGARVVGLADGAVQAKALLVDDRRDNLIAVEAGLQGAPGRARAPGGGGGGRRRGGGVVAGRRRAGEGAGDPGAGPAVAGRGQWIIRAGRSPVMSRTRSRKSPTLVSTRQLCARPALRESTTSVPRPWESQNVTPDMSSTTRGGPSASRSVTRPDSRGAEDRSISPERFTTTSDGERCTEMDSS